MVINPPFLNEGLSYPISGRSQWTGSRYPVPHKLVPHGISVSLTGPAVFQWTTPSSPDRHREACTIFNEYKPDGIQVDRLSDEDVGKVLHDRIARLLVGLDMPRGLQAIG